MVSFYAQEYMLASMYAWSGHGPAHMAVSCSFSQSFRVSSPPTTLELFIPTHWVRRGV